MQNSLAVASNVLSVPICVFAGKTDFGICFSDRRRKRSAISYFFGEDSFAKMTPRPAAGRHIFRVVVDDFYLICPCRIR